MLKIEQIDHIPDGSFMDCLFITCGTFITIAKVTRLEQVINEDPKDLIARLQVIGFYFHQLLQVQARSASRFPAINISESAASARHPHVLWMIDHRPSDFVCGTPQLTYQPIQRLYEETKAHWLRQIRPTTADPRLIQNAANFFMYHEPQLAEELRMRATTTDSSKDSETK